MADSNNKMENVLKIDERVIYKVKIEKNEEFEQSFFHDVYDQATVLLNDIINDNKNHGNVDNDFNNIIAFIGERGSGKTSSMISFSESLRERKIKEHKFHLLDMIDPSVFDNRRDSIVEIIVATMFKKFKKKLKENQGSGSYESDKLKLIAQFEKVYKDIKTLNNNKNNIFNESAENIEALVDLASAVNMKKDLEILVKLYLTYMESEKNFLVISIDDLDMNIASGEKMIEEIRKYLVTPQIVILMAIRFPQLEMLVKQKNIKELKILVDHAEKIDETKTDGQKENFKGIEGELENKTDKYLEKIIPYNKRIFMPEFNSGNVKIEIKLKNLNREKQSIAECIAKLYYDYLRYIIVTPAHYNVIMPNTLRELVELIQIFDKMQIVSVENESEKIVKNIGQVKKYFFDTFIHKIDDIGMKKLLQEVVDAPLISINRKILLFLNGELKKRRKVDTSLKEKDETKKKDGTDIDFMIDSYIKEIDDYSRPILEESVNVGDIVTWSKLFADMNLFTSEKNFSELLKSIYSFRLLEGLYSGEKDLLYVVEKDVAGRYFEVVDPIRDRNWKQINELSIKIETKPQMLDDGIDDVRLFYQLLEPDYNMDKIKYNKKFYVNHVYTAEAKRGDLRQSNGEGRRPLNNYKFKPLNIMGIADNLYQKDNDEQNTTIYQDFNKKGIEIKAAEYLLICNMDFYMRLLDGLNKNVFKARLDETTYEKRIKLIYRGTIQTIDNLCNQCEILDIRNIRDVYYEKFNNFFKKIIKQDEENNKQKEHPASIKEILYSIDESEMVSGLVELIKKYDDSSKNRIKSEDIEKIKNEVDRIRHAGRQHYVDKTRKRGIDFKESMKKISGTNSIFAKEHEKQIKNIVNYITNHNSFKNTPEELIADVWGGLDELLNHLLDILEHYNKVDASDK